VYEIVKYFFLADTSFFGSHPTIWINTFALDRCVLLGGSYQMRGVLHLGKSDTKDKVSYKPTSL
jgi:hypothetical protein